MKQKIVIIGGVAGGATAAIRLRRNDEHAQIILFERGEFVSFANCGLPYYIGGVITNRESLIVQTADEIEEKFNIDVRVQNEVIAIHRDKKTIEVKNLITGDQYEESYDYVIISTGAAPLKPRIPGLDMATNVFTLRNIPDVDAIKTFIDTQKPKRATVIGGGFIGVEMMENLHHLGLKVTLVEMADQLLAPIDSEMATILHSYVREQGVTLILKDGVKQFEDNGKHIQLSSGHMVESDLTILAIGVKPENELAKNAGLTLGARGGIHVNDYLQTNDPSIYAIGDATEVTDYVNRGQAMIPLAGPANKQGRIAADNIYGRNESYQGAMGTSVAKVFHLIIGATGNNEKTLKSLGVPYQAIHIHPGSHAGYYPGSSTISMKLLFNPFDETIYGAQAIGMEGVDKRIDVIATAIYARMKVSYLKNLELAYAPPFSSAKDPVNMLGFVADNLLRGHIKTTQWSEIESLIAQNAFILDARDQVEFELGAIPTSVNIPFTQIRSRLSEIPQNQTIYVTCQTGIRAYSTCRILNQFGYDARNIDGGYKTYQCVYLPDAASGCITSVDDAGFMKIDELIQEKPTMENEIITLEVNACGMQCPGPIVQVYKAIQTIKEGEVLRIQATDYGFLKDIKNWADKSGHRLLNLNTEGGIITATIQKGQKQTVNNEVTSSKENTTIVVFSQDLDKAIAAFIIATGAASMGKKVSLFFTFWGLNILRKDAHVKVKKTFIERMFGFMMPRGVKKLPISNMNMLGMGPAMIRSIMKKKNVDSLSQLMSNAMEMGVKVVACAMSMDIMGIKKEELIDNIEIAGVATYLSDTTEANHNLFI